MGIRVLYFYTNANGIWMGHKWDEKNPMDPDTVWEGTKNRPPVTSDSIGTGYRYRILVLSQWLKVAGFPTSIDIPTVDTSHMWISRGRKMGRWFLVAQWTKRTKYLAYLRFEWLASFHFLRTNVQNMVQDGSRPMSSFRRLGITTSMTWVKYQ